VWRWRRAWLSAGAAEAPDSRGPARAAPLERAAALPGKRASDEVVQLYIHDVVSSVTRPVQELKGFRRIHLKPGESKKVELPLGFDELSFYDVNMQRIVEPGRFEVMVGGSSDKVSKVNLDVVSR
jgi:beta-glucosidase